MKMKQDEEKTRENIKEASALFNNLLREILPMLMSFF